MTKTFTRASFCCFALFSMTWISFSGFLQDKVITNDRWGKGCSCKHGGFYNCADRYTPGKLPDHKWEKCQNLDVLSWGYRREMKLGDVMDLPSIIKVRAYNA